MVFHKENIISLKEYFPKYLMKLGRLFGISLFPFLFATTPCW